MGNNRIHYFDVAKGILILLVIYGHIYGNSYAMDNNSLIMIRHTYSVFLPFYMPCFFMISGFCSNFNKETKSIFISCTRSIFLPSIVFSFFIYGNYLFDSNKMLSLLNNILYYGGEFWFLSSLFLAKIIYCFLYKVFHKIGGNTLLFFISIALFISCYIILILIPGPYYWYIDHTFLLLPYFCVGQLLRTKQYEFNKKSDFFYMALLPLCIFLSYKGIIKSEYFYFVPGITLKLINTNISNLLPLLLLSFSGSFFLLRLSKIISHNTILEYIGRNSLIIYCVHCAILSRILKILSPIYRTGNEITVATTVIASILLTLFISFVIVRIFNMKYMKILIGK